MTTFKDCLAVILKEEGGYVNHPRDPGGMTNLGVTKRTWEEWTHKPATEKDMRALTPDLVAPLYEARYWKAIRCDQMPGPLALCVFDFSVNAGPNRAGRYLQRIVGAVQDGQVGPATIAAVNAFVASHGVAEAVRQYQDARRAYYKQLPTFKTFGKGWLRRVVDVETAALRMVP